MERRLAFMKAKTLLVSLLIFILVLGISSVNVVKAAFAHDMAVTNVTVSKTAALRGENVTITVQIKNNGTNPENCTVVVSAGLVKPAPDQDVLDIAAGNTQTLTFNWDTDHKDFGAMSGNYTVEAEILNYTTKHVFDDEKIANNEFTDGYVVITMHDVAVTDVRAKPTGVSAGETVQVNATVKNEGDYYETFSVTAYWNTTHVIGTKSVTDLENGTSTVLTFSWDTTGLANAHYELGANASTVTSETEIDQVDNTRVDGIVRIPGVHDIAITDVSFIPDVYSLGQTVDISTTVRNEGDFDEVFDVTTYRTPEITYEKVPSTWTGGWTDPGKVTASDDDRASTTANVTETYGGYGFAVGAFPITKVKVGVEVNGSVYYDAINDIYYYDYLNVTVSNDGGTTFGINHTEFVGDVDYDKSHESTHWVDVSNDFAWTPTMLTDANFRVKITAIILTKDPVAHSITVDWLPVQVSFYKTDEVELNMPKEASTLAKRETTKDPFDSTTVTTHWDTTWLSNGTYLISSNVTELSGETDTADNKYVDSKAYFPKIYVNPSSIVDTGLTVGKKFTVTINVADFVDVQSFEFRLRWNGDILNVTGVWQAGRFIANITEGPFLRYGVVQPMPDPLVPGGTYFSKKGYNEPDAVGVSDYIYVSNTFLGTQYIDVFPVSGRGVLATVQFEVIKVGASGLDLYATKVVDPNVNPYPHVVGDCNFVNEGWTGQGDVGGPGGSGDPYKDNKVDIFDLVIVARAMGTDSSWPSGTGWNQWNPDADINGDDEVDIYDLTIVAINYGQPYT